MNKIFENDNFVLSLTGHSYDFVAIMETKTDEPLTFFFSNDMDDDGDIFEDTVVMLDVCKGLNPDEEDEVAMSYADDYDNIDWFRTRDDKTTGFLADPRERGRLLAIVKNYCPERLQEVEEYIY